MDRFDLIVGDTAEYLRDAWPELREVRFEIGFMPPAADAEGIPRWIADRTAGRIVLYRLPVERLERGIAPSEAQSRMSIEAAVFRAAADYLDRDPWDLFPDRHRH